MKRSVLVLASILSLTVSAPSVVRAEGFVDLRVGGAFTEDNDVDVSFGGASATFPTEYKDSVTGGVRGGYWFDAFPYIGIAADVSYFAPDDDTPGGPEYDVIPLSPLLMGRIPIGRTEEFPHGRFQPYIGVGPGIFISLADFGGGNDDDTVEVGPDVHAGVNVQVTRLVSLFAEYRYTYVEPEFHIQGVDVEPQLSTHHVGVGVGFHF